MRTQLGSVGGMGPRPKNCDYSRRRAPALSLVQSLCSACRAVSLSARRLAGFTCALYFPTPSHSRLALGLAGQGVVSVKLHGSWCTVSSSPGEVLSTSLHFLLSVGSLSHSPHPMDTTLMFSHVLGYRGIPEHMPSTGLALFLPFFDLVRRS